MRLASAMLLSALVVLPIAGAAVDPGSLVIRTTDVPAGFELDRGESGVRAVEQGSLERDRSHLTSSDLFGDGYSGSASMPTPSATRVT